MPPARGASRCFGEGAPRLLFGSGSETLPSPSLRLPPSPRAPHKAPLETPAGEGPRPTSPKPREGAGEGGGGPRKKRAAARATRDGAGSQLPHQAPLPGTIPTPGPPARGRKHFGAASPPQKKTHHQELASATGEVQLQRSAAASASLGPVMVGCGGLRRLWGSPRGACRRDGAPCGGRGAEEKPCSGACVRRGRGEHGPLPPAAAPRPAPPPPPPAAPPRRQPPRSRGRSRGGDVWGLGGGFGVFGMGVVAGFDVPPPPTPPFPAGAPRRQVCGEPSGSIKAAPPPL